MTGMPRAAGPAPLDLDQVRACLVPPGTMLPGEAYTGGDVLRWERRVIFAGGWVCAGLAADLPPGTRTAVEAGDEPVLLVRDHEGVLRGFANVCRHRGHELQACGTQTKGRLIACPYHNWVYDQRGRLHRVPYGHEPAEARSGSLGLAGVPVAEWHGLVFVNASGDAPPIAGYLAGLDEIVAPYEMERLAVAASHEYEMAANWKLAVENYQECYHCSAIHPELCRVSPPHSGDNFAAAGLWAGGDMELADGAQTMSLTGASGGAFLRGLSGERLRRVVYLQLFPNLLLSLHPDYVMTHLLDPVAPDLTRVTCQWLFPPEASGADPAYAADFWDITNRQDWAACEGVQRGVSSRAFVPGPLSPTTEDAVFEAVAMVARAYLTGRVAPIHPDPPARAATAPDAGPRDIGTPDASDTGGN